MTTTELPPAEMLKQAMDIIRSGDTQAGAAVAYRAAFSAVQESARRHGYPCDDRSEAIAFLHVVDGIPPAPEGATPGEMIDHVRFTLDGRIPVAFASFSVAEALKVHAETPIAIQHADPVQFGDSGRVENAIPVIRELIAMLIKPENEEGAHTWTASPTSTNTAK